MRESNSACSRASVNRIAFEIAGPARRREPLELVHRRVGEPRAARAGDRGERPDGLAVGAEEHRQRRAGKPRALGHVVEPVAVDDLQRPQVGMGRHLEQRSLDLVVGEARRARRPGRRVVADHDQRRVDARHPDDRVERPVEDVVGVERRGELRAVADPAFGLLDLLADDRRSRRMSSTAVAAAAQAKITAMTNPIIIVSGEAPRLTFVGIGDSCKFRRSRAICAARATAAGLARLLRFQPFGRVFPAPTFLCPHLSDCTRKKPNTHADC